MTRMAARTVPHSRRVGKAHSRASVLCGIGVALAIVTGTDLVQAAEKGSTRFWNLTGETIIHFTMAPAGTTEWGPDQCSNDRDGSVDFDERLRITDVSSGAYDVRLTDKTGRSCLVKGVKVELGKVFSIGREALDHCSGP